MPRFVFELLEYSLRHRCVLCHSSTFPRGAYERLEWRETPRILYSINKENPLADIRRGDGGACEINITKLFVPRPLMKLHTWGCSEIRIGSHVPFLEANLGNVPPAVALRDGRHCSHADLQIARG